MEPVLSFELSVIDVVLVIAVVVLMLLYLTKRQGQPTNKPELSVKGQEKLLEKPKMPVKAAQKKVSKTQPSADFKCAHEFGYLKNLPKKNPVPDECFGCPRTLRCLFPD